MEYNLLLLFLVVHLSFTGFECKGLSTRLLSFYILSLLEVYWNWFTISRRRGRAFLLFSEVCSLQVIDIVPRTNPLQNLCFPGEVQRI